MTSADFSEYVDYWDLYEDEDGLTTSIVTELSQYIRSPILLLGSGQGLISECLISWGEKVTSVDISQEMADKALERRGIQTVVADVATVKLQQQFSTIIVSTGIIDTHRLDGEFLDQLLANIKTHSHRAAHILFFYFWNSPWEQAKQLLGIYKKPSSEIYFWQAQGNLETAKRLLVSEGGIPQETVDEIFNQWQEDLQAMQELILRVGERYRVNNGQDPEPYFAKAMPIFASLFLTEQQELDLKNKLQLSSFQIDKLLSFKDNRVLICTVKS